MPYHFVENFFILLSLYFTERDSIFKAFINNFYWSFVILKILCFLCIIIFRKVPPPACMSNISILTWLDFIFIIYIV